VRRNAARAIGEMGEKNQAVPAAAKARVPEAARPALTTAMESDPDADVRSEAKSALAKLGAVAAGGAPKAALGSPPSAAAAPASSAGSNPAHGGARARKTFEESSFYRALGSGRGPGAAFERCCRL
jgi:HEAT repeat protein